MLSVKNKKKIIIGCAQFGSNYGISNSLRPNLKEQKKILDLAKRNNIGFIDSSPSYGDAEKRLGNIGVKKFKVISKISKLSNKKLNSKNLKEIILKDVKKSLKNLNINKLHGLLLHNSSDLFNKRGIEIYKAMLEAKKQKLTKKIGISIYDPNMIEKILNNYNFDIIQAPFNVIDRRLLNKNILNSIKKKKIEIHIRSIFLQGLLLLKNENIKNYFNKWKKLFLKWMNFLQKNQIEAQNVCVNYAFSIKQFNKVIIGFNSHDELKQILNIKKKSLFLPKKIMSNSKLLIHPHLWKKK